MRILSTILFVTLNFVSLMSQVADANKVLLIGEEDVYYEELIANCNALLLSVADDSMNEAFDLWTAMLSQLETEAESSGHDIKGVKLWINLFWNADGTIKNIFYYPKPNSKNMDFDLMKDILENFAAKYVLPKDASTCFSHYGSAAFPVRTSIKREAK